MLSSNINLFPFSVIFLIIYFSLTNIYPHFYHLHSYGSIRQAQYNWRARWLLPSPVPVSLEHGLLILASESSGHCLTLTLSSSSALLKRFPYRRFSIQLIQPLLLSQLQQHPSLWPWQIVFCSTCSCGGYCWKDHFLLLSLSCIFPFSILHQK